MQWRHVRYNRAVLRESRFETISQSFDVDQDFNVGVRGIVKFHTVSEIDPVTFP